MGLCSGIRTLSLEIKAVLRLSAHVRKMSIGELFLPSLLEGWYLVVHNVATFKDEKKKKKKQ